MKSYPTILLLLLLAACSSAPPQIMTLSSAKIYNGSGEASYTGDLAINADTIAVIGDLHLPGDQVISFRISGSKRSLEYLLYPYCRYH